MNTESEPESAPQIRILPEAAAGRRLDQALSEIFPEFSRTRLQTWLSEGKITVDGAVSKAKQRVRGGETIWIDPQPVPDERYEGQAIPIDIVHEDEQVIVVNKRAGLVVHPGAGNPDGTLLNALLHHDPGLASVPRAGIVHRIDKDTTGLLVVARTLVAHKSLVDQLKSREVSRQYWAILQGALVSGGVIDAPIARHPTLRTRMQVGDGGREARTYFKIGERFRHHTLIRATLDTGRTHQIRVHMSHHGYPIVGDPVYTRLRIPAGADESLRQALRGFPRQALHAGELTFCHPASGESVTFEAPLPTDFLDLRRILVCHDT